MKPLPKVAGEIGIDLGLKEFAVCSNGQHIANPKVYRKYEQKLGQWQRRMARRQKGGANWRKAKQKVARVHEKIVNQRQEFLHQLSIRLIRENQTISIETLKVANMLKNHKLAKSIADASWSEFKRLLTYKCEWYGRTLKFAPMFEPTSQTCHVCGEINEEVRDLSVRQLECPACCTVHDRDENAAHNIKQVAI